MVVFMKMTVIGAGYVGMSTALCFAHTGHKTILLENDPERYAKLKSGYCPFYEPKAQEWLNELLETEMIAVTNSPASAITFGDVIWIAVNTPADIDGTFDLSALESVIEDILKYRKQDVTVVIKSTVATGTCRRLLRLIKNQHTSYKICLVFNPEFLREGHAIKDFMNPNRVIVGTESGDASSSINEAYESLGIESSRIISTNYENAEVTKQASNSFLAIKLTYINELANYCRRVSADIHMVTFCMGLDERIAAGYMEPGIGYGGACLPKDTSALATDASRNRTPLTVLEQAISANEKQIINAAEIICKHMKFGSVLTVWGISFKPESGDLRCSPAWKILNILVEKHYYHIRVYDPYIKSDSLEMISLPNNVKVCNSMNESIDNADGLAILTAHNQFSEIDLKTIKTQMRGQNIFDFFDFYTDESVKSAKLKRITKTD